MALNCDEFSSLIDAIVYYDKFILLNCYYFPSLIDVIVYYGKFILLNCDEFDSLGEVSLHIIMLAFHDKLFHRRFYLIKYNYFNTTRNV